MANRYWVGGTGTWNTTSTTNWSASDGGASGASVPTSADSVFFTDSSGLTGASVITLSGNINCLGFNFTASANCSFTATSFALGCNASFTLTNASVNFSAIGNINSTGTLVRGFNSACNISNVTVSFITGGSVTLQSNINCNAVVFNVPVDFAGYFISAIGQATISSVPTSIDLRSGTTVVSVAGTYNFTSGSIRTNGFTLSSGTFVYGSTASLLALDGINFLPSFTHTAGTFTLNKDLALSSTSTYTLTAGTLTLGANLTVGIFSSSNTNIRSIAFGIYNITLNHTTAAQTILNVASAQNFTWTGTGGFITDASVTRTINVGSITSGTLLGFNVTYTGTGNQTQTLTNSDFNTLDFGTTTCSVTTSTGQITVANLIFSASGTYTGVTVRLADQHDGTGAKTFTTNGKTVSSLQVIGTATTTFTFTGSLGTSTYTQTSGNVDFAGFNLTCSSTVSYTAGTLSNIGTITCTTWTITGTFNFTNGTITPSTSFVLTSGAFNYSGGTLSAVPTFTHTAGTVTLGNSYALTSSGTYTFSSGNLNLGNYTLTTGSFSSGGSNARTVDFSTSSLIQLTGNNATIWEGGSVGFTITGTMQVVSTYSGSTGTRTVNVGTGWTQATDFDVKCNACVGIQINNGATDTVVIAGVVKDLDLTGLTCTFSPGVMTVYGDYTIPASGGTVSATANLTTFASTNATARTITISRSIDFPITFNGVGGTFQLGASLTNGTTRTVILLNGTFNLNNYNLTTGLFVSNNSNTRALDFGSGSITVNGIGTPWDTTITTGLTVTGSKTVNVTTAGTSTITVIPGVITESNAFDFNITGTTTINFLTVGSHATRNVDFTGFTGTIAATAAVTIYGNYTLSAGMTVTSSASIMTFGATSGTKTITTNGKTMPRVVINGVGGTFNLGSSLTISGSLQVTAGTFDTTASNFNITCTSIDSITTSSVRAISLNGSTVTVSGTAGVTLNDVNLSFNCGTSQLTLSNATSTVLSVIGSETFRDVSFTGGAPTITLIGTNTYNNLTFTNGASAIPSVVTITGNQTVGGTLSNTSTNATTRLQLQSSVSGTQIVLSAATESLSDVDFKDIDAAGAAIPFVGTRFGDLGNNTDITFDAARTLYWNLVAGGNWNATAWATTSGGTPDINNFPLAQDTCIIENTGLNTSATITMNANWNFGTLNMSTRTNAMTLAIGTTTPTVTGNWTNGTGTTLTGTGTVNFKNIGTTQTITASGITFTPNISYDSVGGTLQLATALTLGATSTFTLIKGTLSLNGFTLTTGIFSSNNSFTRSIDFGTTNIILAHTTAGTNVLDMASLSNFSTSGTGQFTSAMGVTRTFTSGTLGSVTGSLAFNGTSQFATISYGQGGIDWVGTLNVSSDATPFTLESWINLSSTPSGFATIASLWETFANTDKAFAFSVNSSLQLTIQTGNAGGVATLSGGAIPLNTWTHVAWVKGSSLQYLYINGQLVASNALNPNVGSPPHDWVIGARYQSGYTSFFPGNISNVRFVNGVQVYTGNFTPSTSPLTLTQSSGTNISAITAGQTELLLNTPNNASFLSDSSVNNFSLSGSAVASASTPITSLPAAGTPPSLALTSGAAIPTFASGSYFTNLNFTGTTSVPAASTITINGNLTLATGGTYTSLGVTMAGTGTITPLAKTIAAFIINTSGTATLAAAFGCTTFTMTAGTLNLASFNLTCSSTATFTAGTLSNIATITCTTWTTQGTFAHSQGTITPSTSFVITSGSYTQTGTSVLSAVPTFTQTAGDVTFRSTYALTATGTYTLTAGALTLGGDLTTGIFSSNTSNIRSIAFSTFNIVLAHTTLGQTVLAMATLTNFSWTGTGGFTSAMTVTRTFQSGQTAGASSTTVPNLSLISGASIPTITTGSSFNNLIFTGSTSSPASATVSVYGNLTLASGGGYSSLTVNMRGAAGNINGAGTSSLLGLVINNTGSTTLTAALTLAPSGTTTLTLGNLNLNGFTLSTGIFSSDNTNTRSITFGVGNIVLTHATAATVVLSMSTATGFTYTSSGTYGSATGCFQATMSTTRTFRFGNTAGGSATNSPRLYLASGASIATLTTASWFSELDFGTTAFAIAATNLNLNSFKSNSSTSVLTALTATMVGTGTIKTNTSIGALIINSTSGTTTLDSSTATILRCTSCSILSGTLDINSQTLASTGVVSFSGGTLISTSGSSITCTSFQVTGATFNFTAGSITPSTSFVITSGSFTYSGTASLSAVATFTHTNGTVTFSKNYSLTATGTYTFTAGSLVLGDGLTLTTGIFSSSGTGTRSIAFGNITAGNISLAHTTAGQIVLAMADITNFSSTGPGGFISVMGVTRTFTCGTTGGSVSSAPNLTLNTGSQIGTISTGSWFRNLIFDATTFTVPATVVNITESISLSAASSTFTSLSVTMRGTGTITPNGKAIAAFTVNTSGTATLAAALSCTSYVQTAGTTDFGTFNLTSSGTGLFTSGTLTNVGLITCTTFTVAGVFAHTDGTITPSTSFVTTSGSYTQTGTSVLSAVPTFTQTAGDVTFRSTYSLSTLTGTYTLTAGTLTLGGDLTVGIFSSTNTNTRSIAFSTFNIVLTHTTAGTTVLSMADITNFTPSGTGAFTTAMSVTRSFSIGSTTGGSITTAPNLSLTSGASIPTFTSGSWINNLDFTGSTCTPATSTLNIESLTLASGGTYTNLSINAIGTGTITPNGKTIAAFVVNNGAGTTTLAGALNCSTYTQTSGNIDFASFNLTCSSTGFFSSGTLSNIGTISCTTFTVAGVFAHTDGTITPSTSFVTLSGSYTQTGTSVLSAVPTFTQTAGNVTFRSTYSLSTLTGTYTLSAGALTLGGNLTVGIFSSTNTNTRSIAFGSSNIVLTHTTAATKVLNASDITNFSCTGTGGFESAMGVTRTFDVCTVGSGSNFGSLSFNGTSRYLSVPSDTAFAFGSGDFTIEFWLYVLTFPTNPAIAQLFDNRPASTQGAYPLIYLNFDGSIRFWVNSADRITSSVIPSDTWNHIAISRSGTTTKIFINGTQSGSSYTDTTSYLTSTVRIGAGYSGGASIINFLNGYISNYRVVKGVAVYTGNFTVPKVVLESTQEAGVNINAITGTETSLLLKTPNTNSFLTDSSVNNFTITNTGSVTSSTLTPVPVTGLYQATINGSVSFNGIGQLLSIPSNSVFSFGTGDFTIEHWVYSTSFAIQAATISLFSNNSGSYITGQCQIVVNTNGTISFSYATGLSTTVDLTTSTTITTNAWYHIAVVRSGSGSGNLKIYINGTVAATSAGAVTQAIGTTSTGRIGLNGNSAGNLIFTGYLSNMRIVKGNAVYTANFTVPFRVLTTSQTANTNGNPSSAIAGSETSLLLDTYYGGNFLRDASFYSINITASGGAPSSTVAPIPNNGSISFNGTSQYLMSPTDAALAMGTGDFTVECWWYQSVNNADRGFLSSIAASVGTSGYGFQLCGNGAFTGGNSIGTYDTFAWTLPLNQWNHVALVRISGICYAYVNGILASSGATTLGNNLQNSSVAVGTSYTNNFTFKATGYISNVRLVKGVAVYTSNFTVPSSPFTAIQSTNVNGNPSAAITSGQTSLLLNTYYASSISSTTDGSINNFTITNNGAAVSSIDAPPLPLATSVGITPLPPSLFLNSGSSVPTFTNNSWFKDLVFTGSSTTPATATVLITKDLTLSTGGTYTGLTVIAAGTGNYTSAGKTIPYFYIDANGGTATLADDLNVSDSITLISGTFNLSSYNTTSVSFFSNGTSTRSITGSGTYSLTGSGSTTFYNINAAGITMSGVTVNMTSASAKTFAGGGGSYPILNQGGAGALTISGNNSFTDITATTRPSTISFTAGSTQTVTGFTLSGTLGNLVTINSTTPGTQFNLSRASGTVSVGYLNIEDSNATGGASWYADVTSFNVGNNTGWIFTAPPGGVYLGNFFAFF
jgi:hypothetical protein